MSTGRSLAEHRALVAEVCAPMAPIEISVAEAAGTILVDDVVAAGPLPAFDAAAYDGYAVSSLDLAGVAASKSKTLPVSQDVGFDSRTPRRLVGGTAARIVSGAPVPLGADAVVPAADTDGGIARVAVHGKVVPGAGVVRAGSVAAANSVVVSAGSRLGGRQLALVVQAGRSRLTVRPAPRVVIVAVGDELLEPGARPRPGAVTDSNTAMLAAMVEEAGARSYRATPVRDARGELTAALEDQLVRADVIITTGGLSGGHGETLPQVLEGLGDYTGVEVAMTPGAHQGIGVVVAPGSKRQTVVIALPGRPAEALIAFEAYVRPAIRTMAGYLRAERPTLEASVDAGWASPIGVVQYVPVRLAPGSGGVPKASPLGDTDAPTFADLAAADALAVIPEDQQVVVPGQRVTCIRLEG